MLRHFYRVLDHYFRETTKGVSPYWDLCKKDFLESHPTCEACGGTRHLAVHHVKPIDDDVRNENDWSNLMALCMGKYECHFRLGHGGDYASRVYNVRDLAAEVLAQPALRPMIEERAHKERVYIHDFGKE